MAITYSYKITSMTKAPSKDGLTDVITGVRFTYTGVDEDGNEGTFQGATPMPSPDSENFTPLAELTEEMVIEWVKVTHPIDHMQERIQKQIDEKKAPTKEEVTGLDWLTPPAPAEPVAEETTTTTTTAAAE